MCAKKLKRLSDGSIANYDELFEPYALAIGYLIHDWNDLQGEFMLLYTDLVRGRSAHPDYELIWTIWHAVPVDRFQRAMVREAAREKYSNIFKRPNAKDAALWRAIKWAVDHADGMGRKRDDAVHVPMVLFLSEPPRFTSLDTSRHPVAEKLRYADLIEEFTLYREQVSVLHAFVFRLREHLQSGRRLPLPEIPTWPTQYPKGGHKLSRRRGRSIKRKRPPRSSRE